MPYNFIDLVNRVNKSLNEVELTSANFLSAGGWHSFAKEAVNLAIQDINDEPVEWPFYFVQQTLVLTPDQSRYPFPADCKKIDFNTFRIRKDDTLNNKTISLFSIDYEDYLIKYSDMEYNIDVWAALPTIVAKTNGMEFLLVPPPDQAYTLIYEYYRIPNRLEQPEDVPLIPRVFESTIMDGAMYYAYMFREDSEAAAMAKERFDEKKKSMRRNYINRSEYVRSTYIMR